MLLCDSDFRPSLAAAVAAHSFVSCELPLYIPYVPHFSICLVSRHRVPTTVPGEAPSSLQAAMRVLQLIDTKSTHVTGKFCTIDACTLGQFNVALVPQRPDSMAIVPLHVLPALSQRMVELSESSSGYPNCHLSTAKALVDLLIKELPIQLPFEVVVLAGLETDRQSQQSEQTRALQDARVNVVVSVLVCCRYLSGSRGLSCYPFCSTHSCPTLVQSILTTAFSSNPQTATQAAFSDQACRVTLCSFPRSLAPYLSSIPCFPKGESPCHLLCFSGNSSDLCSSKASCAFPPTDRALLMSVGPLSLEHAALVDSKWTYHAPHTLSIMQHIIACGNSYAVFIDGQPVSWALRTAYGSIGMLHTLEDFRRRGYAAVAVRGLASKIIENGGVPFCHIVEGNSSSLALFHSLGFSQPCPEERFDWYHLSRQAE
jgi:hypothetical protein